MSSRLTFASLIPKFKRLGQYIDIHGDYIEFFKSFFDYLVLSSFVRDKTGFNRIKPLSADFCSKVRLFANPDPDQNKGRDHAPWLVQRPLP